MMFSYLNCEVDFFFGYELTVDKSRLSIYLPTLPTYLPIVPYLSVCLSIYLSTYLRTYRTVSICLSVYLCIYLST